MLVNDAFETRGSKTLFAAPHHTDARTYSIRLIGFFHFFSLPMSFTFFHPTFVKRETWKVEKKIAIDCKNTRTRSSFLDEAEYSKVRRNTPAMPTEYSFADFATTPACNHSFCIPATSERVSTLSAQSFPIFHARAVCMYIHIRQVAVKLYQSRSFV